MVAERAVAVSRGTERALRLKLAALKDMVLREDDGERVRWLNVDGRSWVVLLGGGGDQRSNMISGAL
jgi:hypothetical protein